jgi:hypothetical protein
LGCFTATASTEQGQDMFTQLNIDSLALDVIAHSRDYSQTCLKWACALVAYLSDGTRVVCGFCFFFALSFVIA